MSKWKQRAIPLIRRALEPLPSGMLLPLVKALPKLHAAFPEGRHFRIDYFLGDLKADIDTTYVIERAMLSGRYDPQTLDVIAKLVRPGDVCMDVGANIGAIAFALAKRAGPEGQVLAFEPGKLTFDRLRANLALNPRVANIVPLQLGLSDRDGTLYWHEHENNRGSANLSGETQGNGIAVPVTTVDGFFLKRPAARLDFVKIDVESMEYEVIKGGMRTWEALKPILYYETLPAFEAFRKQPVFKWIEDLLKPLGYSFFRIEGGGALIPTAYPDLSANTLAIPPGRMPGSGPAGRA